MISMNSVEKKNIYKTEKAPKISFQSKTANTLVNEIGRLKHNTTN